MESRIYSITYPLLFLAIFCLNSFYLQWTWLGALLLVSFLLLCGLRTGQSLAHTKDLPSRIWIGVWFVLSGVMIIGSVAYYLASVPAMLFQILVFFYVTCFIFTQQKSDSLLYYAKHWWSEFHPRLTLPISLGILSTLFLTGLFLHLVSLHKITDAVRSPWDQIPLSVLCLFGLAIFLCSAFLYRGREKVMTFILFTLILGSLFSFLAVAYPIGYGFDPFIHKATETHLAQFETITPKPFYYIGQYSLVLFFSHAFSLPIDLVDTWLVPLLATLLLPLAWFAGANTLIKKPRHAFFCLLGLFLLPLETFTVTTPQNLANLWMLLSILASIPLLLEENAPHWSVFLLGILATLLIHPIAGIPIFFYFLLLFLSQHHHRISDNTSQIVTWMIVIAASLAIPASFVVQSLKSGNGFHLTLSNLNPVILVQSMNLNVFWQNKFSPLLDFVYVYGQNIFLLALLLSAFAWWSYKADLSKRMRVLFFMILILGVNYLLLANVIDFSFLIDYERANYANRLIPMITFFLSPLLLLGFGHISINIRTKPIALKLASLFLLSTFATASCYLAFPRRDAYTTSHAFNTSQADMDAVYLIDEWAHGVPYIALANQSVSAVAMKQLGFRYYGDLFFYPIPTGGTMYQKFLDMNATPSRETIHQALALIPKEEYVHAVFYVVDTYWWQADQIIEQSKAIADDWKSVNGSVYIFRFDEK